jgi:DNA modification methylase
MHIELRPIDSITPYDQHPRLNDGAVDAVAKSLKEFGFRQAIVVDTDGVIVVGHTRWKAAKLLGMSTVPVHVAKELTAAQARAYRIADNQTATIADWNMELLPVEISELKDAGFDTDLLGFDDAEMREIMGELAPTVDEDVVPEPRPETVSRRGDLWLLGDQRLLNGDSTSAEDVRRVMNGQRAVLFQTDPPFLVDYDGTNHPNSGKNWHAKRNKDWSKTYGTGWDDADANSDLYDKFIATAIAEAIAENAAWYCWHASRRQAMLEAVWTKHGAFAHQQLVWNKNRPILTRSWYMWKHEPCLMGWIKGNKPHRATKEFMPSVWDIPTVSSASDAGHPTSKPVRLFAIPMQQHTVEGDVCFEPFSGSGSQIIAAEQLKRRCYAVELEPVYIDVAVRRWQAQTGKDATLDGDGRTFNEVERERLGANAQAERKAPAAAEAEKQEAA